MEEISENNELSSMPIAIWPDIRLKKSATEITEFGSEIKTLTQQMLATMHTYKGIGLAATQIGVMKRLITYSVDSDIGALINPKIINSDGVVRSEEGCLSFPGLTIFRPRAESIEIQYLDEDGEEVIKVVEGMLAICLQHEIDHLNGKTFIFDMSKIRRDMITAKFNKMKQKRKIQLHNLKKL